MRKYSLSPTQNALSTTVKTQPAIMPVERTRFKVFMSPLPKYCDKMTPVPIAKPIRKFITMDIMGVATPTPASATLPKFCPMIMLSTAL